MVNINLRDGHYTCRPLLTNVAVDCGEFDCDLEEVDQFEREILNALKRTLLGDDVLDPESTAFKLSCPAAQAWAEIGTRIRRSIDSRGGHCVLRL